MRVASYNIHGGIGADRRCDLPRTARLLAELDADVILLQEVGDAHGRGPLLDHGHTLAEAMHMEWAVGLTLPGHSGYGNAILVRGAITESRTFDISVHGREPRGCLRVEAVLAASGQRISAVAVHFGLGRSERRAQLEHLLGPEGPVATTHDPLVLGGDFNDWPPGPTTRQLKRIFLDAAEPSRSFGGTFPARFPFLRLDRLYSTSELSVLSYRVHRSQLARVTSDHLPIVVEYAVSAHERAADDRRPVDDARRDGGRHGPGQAGREEGRRDERPGLHLLSAHDGRNHRSGKL